MAGIPPFRTQTATGAAEPAGSTVRPDVPWWDPGADSSVSPDTDSVVIDGVAVASGSSVVLRPGQRRTDAQDMFLAGMRATVRAVLFDVAEDSAPYLAVTLDGDPAADMLNAHGRYRYFSPDEIEPHAHSDPDESIAGAPPRSATSTNRPVDPEVGR